MWLTYDPCHYPGNRHAVSLSQTDERSYWFSVDLLTREKGRWFEIRDIVVKERLFHKPHKFFRLLLNALWNLY